MHKVSKSKIIMIISAIAIVMTAIVFLYFLNIHNKQTKDVFASASDNIVEINITPDYGYSPYQGAGLYQAIEDSVAMIDDDYVPLDFWGYRHIGIANVENNLNIREIPDAEGTLVGKLPRDCACEVLEIKDGWAHIISGDVEGYVSKEYLYTGPDAYMRACSIVTPVATVTCDSLMVRDMPGTDGNIITSVPKGEELKVLESSDGWIKIDLDDEDAYVSEEYVTVAEQLGHAVSIKDLLYGDGVSQQRVDLCSYAKEFVGNPYVWGGTSLTSGADCSGFVMSVYAHFGISLPHSSSAQSGYGHTVSLDNLKPGDLVFYGNGSSINHVAIYIGNGQVVHASSPSTGIRISGMYYRTPSKAVSILY